MLDLIVKLYKCASSFLLFNPYHSYSIVFYYILLLFYSPITFFLIVLISISLYWLRYYLLC